MSRTNAGKLVLAAKSSGTAVGAFNVILIEHAEALVAGAEHAKLPVILQISENCVSYHKALKPISVATIAIAESASVPVSVHLDHAESEDLVKEVQRIVQALLGYGASMPKELMLYVKNMVFLDGAISRLAPDLDILAEVANISMLFAERHGEQIGRDLGINAQNIELNLDSVKAGFGLDSSVNRLTYRELQQRRELINKRMRDHVRK